jgi:hypothetical protein
MKKLHLFIKIIKGSPKIIKIMWVNALVILIIIVVGFIYKLENTVLVIGLNLAQIVLFFKAKKQLDNKYKLLYKIRYEMALLILDEEFDKNIKNLIDFAQKNPFTIDDLLDMMNGDLKCAGDTKGYFFITGTGIKIVHCIEKQVKGDVRYCSVGLLNNIRLPHPALVVQIIEILGFKNHLCDCIVDIERLKDNSLMAISIREFIENE